MPSLSQCNRAKAALRALHQVLVRIRVAMEAGALPASSSRDGQPCVRFGPTHSERLAKGEVCIVEDQGFHRAAAQSPSPSRELLWRRFHSASSELALHTDAPAFSSDS